MSDQIHEGAKKQETEEKQPPTRTKLSLRRDTLRRLTREELATVAGAARMDQCSGSSIRDIS